MPLSQNANSILYATYQSCHITGAVAVTTTATHMATLHHLAAVTKTAKIREITITVANSTVAAILTWDVIRLTAAPTATAVTPTAFDTGDVATTLTAGHTAGVTGTPTGNPLFVQKYNMGIIGGATLDTSFQPLVLYRWQPGDVRALTIRGGQLEGWAVRCTGSASTSVTATINITWTEQ